MLFQPELSQAMLSQAMLSQAMLSQAMLSQAMLSQAMLSQAMLSQAMLSQAMLSQASGVQISDGIVTGRPFEPSMVTVFDARGSRYTAVYSVRAAPSAGRRLRLAWPRAGLLRAA